MRRAALFFLAIFLSQGVSWAALREEWKNQGKVRTHLFYDGKILVRSEADTNGDGKPDRYYHFFQGREFVLREYDSNYDGKIDKRNYSQWDANKTISTPNGNRMMKIPNPGYKIIWKEEDNNFDGVIDVYRDVRDKSKTKVGRKINTEPAAMDEEAPKDQLQENPGPEKPEAETRVETLNKKYGFTK